jgi:hypothetical protein
MTVDWLSVTFGVHLASVVEHRDEKHLHLHFYLLPRLQEGGRLDLDEFHPGRRMKAAALEAGASLKDGEAAYRAGMSRLQDDFWWSVSKMFRHRRLGGERGRVSRVEHKIRKDLEAERARQQSAIDAAVADLEQRKREFEDDVRRRSSLCRITRLRSRCCRRVWMPSGCGDRLRKRRLRSCVASSSRAAWRSRCNPRSRFGHYSNEARLRPIDSPTHPPTCLVFSGRRQPTLRAAHPPQAMLFSAKNRMRRTVA